MWELPKVSSPQRLTVEIGPSCANSSWRGVEELFAHEGPMDVEGSANNHNDSPAHAAAGTLTMTDARRFAQHLASPFSTLGVWERIFTTIRWILSIHLGMRPEDLLALGFHDVENQPAPGQQGPSFTHVWVGKVILGTWRGVDGLFAHEGPNKSVEHAPTMTFRKPPPTGTGISRCARHATRSIDLPIHHDNPLPPMKLLPWTRFTYQRTKPPTTNQTTPQWRNCTPSQTNQPCQSQRQSQGQAVNGQTTCP